jgi:4-hydroxy-2-oxoheptanedioate aldolase
MQNPKNNLKRALREGKQQVGLWATLSSNYTAEVIAGAGFDWILIDTEHSPADLESVLGQLQAIAPYPTTPVVRLPWNDMVMVKRFLDIGAQSLLIPQVNTAKEAADAVAFTRYGRIKDYARIAHEDICVIVQVESKQALDNLDAICAVDGVDCVFIGPADLHASLGYIGERLHKDVVPMMEDAIRRIKKAGKAPGILADNEEGAKRWLAQGALFVGAGSDASLLARGADALAAKFKS